MRIQHVVSIVSLGLAACGGGKGDADAPTTVIDSPAADAPRGPCIPKSGSTLATVKVADGFQAPVLVTAPIGDSRLFVVEQSGKIVIVKNGTKVATPFVDIEAKVKFGGEQGLLGLAFHPNYATNHKFYVNYTQASNGATVVAEYQAPAGGDVADATERRLITIPQPFANHNAGAIEFGRDGFLYIALGDGGSGGDPGKRAQNDAEWLGKMLRIDVNQTAGAKAYAIPPGNPFASSADGPADPRPEIWHKGLRNPFRFSFDEANGDIYIADVGQDLIEELDAGANSPGINWGWNDREGNRCFLPSSGCATSGRTDPVTQHTHAEGWKSIIAGVTYRGSCFPDLRGQFFYTDYYVKQLWAFTLNTGAAVNDRMVLQSNDLGNVTSIHQDGFGEMFLTKAGAQGGEVRAIVVQ
jgi:glucose/arabinose dehydrogenase